MQHFNATYRNLVGHNMLHTFVRPVATCWKDCCERNLTRFKPESTACNMLQHVVTCTVAKLVQHVVPTNVAICCVENVARVWREL